MNKNKFIQTLTVLKQQREYEDSQYDTLSSVFGSDIEPYKNELFDEIVDILEDIFPETVCTDVKGSDISFFIYEYDFGVAFKIGMVTDADGDELDWTTIERFADYIYKDKD